MSYSFNKEKGFVETWGYNLSEFNKTVSILKDLLNDDFKELKVVLKPYKFTEEFKNLEKGEFISDCIVYEFDNINNNLLLQCKKFCTESTYRINKIDNPKDQIFKFTKVWIESDSIYIGCNKTANYEKWLNKNIKA